uniref:Gag-Pol polyprotein n=1 Tax=Tanacetum cinerariifolium TaxID=118510 RepID=A0A6L2KRQ3_TANCI|nr:hypothetical protein [Tanacetum cinerariifolium]
MSMEIKLTKDNEADSVDSSYYRGCVLSWIAFCFRIYCILSLKDLAFCLQRYCVLRRKHCVLSTSKILHFVSEALRFAYFKDLAWVNERQMQTTEEKVDTSKALDASSVDTERNIRPIYDEELMAKVQTTAVIDVFTIGQHHTEQPKFNNEGEKSNEAKVKHDIDIIETINIELEHKVAKLLKENETLKKHYKELFDSIKITRDKTTEHTTSLIATNDKFKAQLQEKGFAIATLKNELRKSTGNNVNTKFAKSSILGKPMSQPHRNQSVVRQSTAFKSKRPRISKPLCDSQVDVNYNLSKPVTTHYLPKEREAASAKPHHLIASSNSRISLKNIPRFSLNDMVHNHYLEEAKKKTQ